MGFRRVWVYGEFLELIEGGIWKKEGTPTRDYPYHLKLCVPHIMLCSIHMGVAHVEVGGKADVMECPVKPHPICVGVGISLSSY